MNGLFGEPESVEHEDILVNALETVDHALEMAEKQGQQSELDSERFLGVGGRGGVHFPGIVELLVIDFYVLFEDNRSDFVMDVFQRPVVVLDSQKQIFHEVFCQEEFEF